MLEHPVHSRTAVLLKFSTKLSSVEARGRWRERGRGGRRGPPRRYNYQHLPLTAGTRLGPYKIVSALGAGGMGEVFRARDTRLGRDVALKILPDAFADDADRLMRFEREART